MNTTKRTRTDTITYEATFNEYAAEMEASCNTTALLLFEMRHSPTSYFYVAPADVSTSVMRFVNSGCLRIDNVRDGVITLKISELIKRAGLNSDNVLRAHAFSNGSVVQFLTKDARIVVMRISDGVVTKRTDISTLACTDIEDPHREGFSTRETFITSNGVVINVCVHCHEATVYWLGNAVALVDDDIVFGVIVERDDIELRNVYVTESLKVITAVTLSLHLVDIKTGRKTCVRGERKLFDVNISKHVVISVDAAEKYICVWWWLPAPRSNEIHVYSLSEQQLLCSYKSSEYKAKAIDCNCTVIGALQVLAGTGVGDWASISIGNTRLSANFLTFPTCGVVNSYHVTSDGRLMCLVEE